MYCVSGGGGGGGVEREGGGTERLKEGNLERVTISIECKIEVKLCSGLV